MREIVYSTCPVVRADDMTLFERVEVGGTQRFIPFDRRVLWLRQSEAPIVLRHRGRVIREESEFNDFYGYLTSVEAAIKDVWRMAKGWAIQAGDALSVDIDVTIYHSPVLPDNSQEAKTENATTCRKQYRAVGKDWFMSAAPDEDGHHARLTRQVVVARSTVYSTVGGIGTIPPELAAWIAGERADAERLRIV